jgi:hypothetical protein
VPYTPPAGNAVNLVFAGVYTPPAANAVALDFDPPPPNTYTASIAGTLDDSAIVVNAVALAGVLIAGTLAEVSGAVDVLAPGPVSIAGQLDDTTGLIRAAPAASVSLSATLDDITAAIDASWNAGVFRGLTSSKSSAFATKQTHTDKQITGVLNQASHKRPIILAPCQSGTNLQAERGDAWAEVAHKRQAIGSGWDFATARQAEAASRYGAAPHKAAGAAVDWQIAGALTRSLLNNYRSPPRQVLGPSFDYGDAKPIAGNWLAGYGLATGIFGLWSVLPWGVADPHSWIWGGWHYPPPAPADPFYRPSTDLVFYQPLDDYLGGAILEFNRPCYAWPLVSKRTNKHQGVTILLHTVKVTRLPDLVDVPAISATLQFDIDSWAWGVSLNLKGPQAMALLESVNGEPHQVRIEIDGIHVTAMIESWGERRQFGETAYTATGRSPLALMAQPFAPIRSYLEINDKTAAQLIDHELMNTGWSAAYHTDLLQLFTTDWLIPSGTWSYQNKAPIDAIVQIAEAVGARAFADRNAALIHIAPRYPVSPWNWATATPDKTIPLNLIRSINTELNPQPDYNQVYVSGQHQGVLVAVKRQGTAGDKPAPMITDSLITYVNAGRERGRNVLAGTGRLARISLDLPINDITGLIEPGQLVEVSDATSWRGLVTGITITGEHGAASQQIEIERHY